jgi:AbrB family looped-hinge helix DNA binding protein
MQITTGTQEEWLKVLTKGMVTIPKAWRKALKIDEGTVVKARKIENQIIIEPLEKPIPYRIYSQKELQQFLKNDQLSKKWQKKLAKILK